MSTQHFDATGELAAIRHRKRIQQRSRYQYSLLSRFRAELVALHLAGASYRELALWLRERRIKVSHVH